MRLDKMWVYNQISDENVKRISAMTGISPLLSKIFLSRGINDTGYIKRFLNPVLDNLNDPFLLKDMEKAVERIIAAINNREKIIIYGDYDVDGITSTSILLDFLLGQKADASFYIPDRMDEGYGLSMGAIDKIRQMGTSLIITVDCGITAADEVKYIIDSNMNVIVTDHHKCKDILPDCCAVIDPFRPDCTYPFKELAGVGVVFKLIHALCIKLNLGSKYQDYLDMVAIGTVADVVPLTEENRIIVKHGLSKIENTCNTGIKALLNVSGLKGKPINSWGISFVMAPRINAAGRIGDAGRAVRLFNTKDEKEALKIAGELSEENKFRQDTEVEIFQQAVNFIESRVDLEKEKVLVIDGDGWHHGIIGIVASRITERYYRPCVLISREDGIGKGSGRSIEGFDLFKALSHCSSLLDRFGGHELAAGLSLKIENIVEFRTMINQYADEILEAVNLVPKLKIDVKVSKDDITLSNVRELEKLAPFGAGNPGPVFAYDNFTINEIRTVGEDKHLKLRLSDEKFLVDAIGFNMGGLANTYNSLDILDVACSMEINSWNSNEKIQLNLKDIKPNNETLMENKYFMSLDKCMISEAIYEKEEGSENFTDYKIESSDKIIEMISGMNLEKKKAVILANTLKHAKQLEKLLKESSKPYQICFGSLNNFSDTSMVHVIINPEPGENSLSFFDYVLFYGEWISRRYLLQLLSQIDRKKAVFFNDKTNVPNIEEIIPERKDLVAVYQFLKARSKDQLLIEDLYAFSKKIAESYKIRMNYFKVKKCLDIFEELKLLKKEPAGENGIFITSLDKGKEKTNLESSLLYRNLQNLKIG